MSSQIKNNLLKYTKLRFSQAEEKKLVDVYNLNSDFLTIDDSFASFCYDNKTEIEKLILDEQFQNQFLELCFRYVNAFNTKSNQFLRNPKSFEEDLREIYKALIENISSALDQTTSSREFKESYREIIKTHISKFKDLISIDIAGNPQNEAMYFAEKVCSEYSPELQLNVLGIDLNDIPGPILDIGCGENASLVEYLRSSGLQAIGIDKIVAPKPYLFSYSWDEFPFPTKAFGTIISHMAFTNHFVFQHNASTGEPEKYAEIFMKILNSLRIGGKFHYAPAVPFFEKFLPKEKYTVKYSQIVSSEQMVENNTDKDIFSVQIEKKY